MLIFGMSQAAFSIIGPSPANSMQVVENERVDKKWMPVDVKIDSSETPKTRHQKRMDGLAMAAKICGLVSISTLVPGLFLAYTPLGLPLFLVALFSMLLAFLSGFIALRGHTRRRRDAWIGILLGLVGLVAWQIVSYYFYD